MTPPRSGSACFSPLRRGKSDKTAEFLTDSDPRIVAEAARAIHDERIEGAMAKLAVLADTPGQADPVAYRALSANLKLGTAEAARRVARFAARPSEPDHVRVFALKLLAEWTKPSRRDPITGLIHDLPQRDEGIAAARPEAVDRRSVLRVRRGSGRSRPGLGEAGDQGSWPPPGRTRAEWSVSGIDAGRSALRPRGGEGFASRGSNHLCPDIRRAETPCCGLTGPLWHGTRRGAEDNSHTPQG
jgi:hypothetical protein